MKSKISMVFAILMVTVLFLTGIGCGDFTQEDLDNSKDVGILIGTAEGKKQAESEFPMKLKEALDKAKVQWQDEINSTIPQKATYEQLKKFLSEDKTDQKQYKYYHLDASSELINNAHKSGIAAYLTIVVLPRNLVYYLVTFPTKDKGDIDIASLADLEIKLQEGKKYYELNDQLYPGYDDTIAKILRYK